MRMTQNVETKTLKRVPDNKFQGPLSNFNFHLFPIHRFPEILITTVFLYEEKIPRYYPGLKCLCKKQ